MKGKFLDNATKKYNSAYGKMKTGGSSKMKMGGTTKMKKYQGKLSQVSADGKTVNVNVSGKMGRLDADKVRKEQASSGNQYTFTKVPAGKMTASDSSYVRKFEKPSSVANKKKGGTTKMKKYQGKLSQVSAAPRMSPNEMMSTASAGPRTSTMDTGTGMKRSEKIMNKAKKTYERAENIRKDFTGRTLNDYDIANRLYNRSSRQAARAKRIAKRGR